MQPFLEFSCIVEDNSNDNGDYDSDDDKEDDVDDNCSDYDYISKCHNDSSNEK